MSRNYEQLPVFISAGYILTGFSSISLVSSILQYRAQEKERYAIFRYNAA
jgi:hypothetical protein